MKNLKSLFLFVFSFFVAASLFASEVKEMNRSNVTDKEANPNRVKTDSILNFKLGYGFVAGEGIDVGSGVAFGIGYRAEMDNFSLDVNLLDTTINWKDVTSMDMSIIKLGGGYFFLPLSNVSPYLGVNLSFGVTSIDEESQWGLRGGVYTGMEFMRVSDVRFFIQADATLPFYTIYDHYYPTFAFSLGIGF